MASASSIQTPDASWLRLAIDTRRDEIAGIDTDLVRLIRQRARAARQLGRLKREAGIPVVQPEQEAQLMGHWIEAAGDLDPSRVRRLAEDLVDLCRAAQHGDGA